MLYYKHIRSILALLLLSHVGVSLAQTNTASCGTLAGEFKNIGGTIICNIMFDPSELFNREIKPENKRWFREFSQGLTEITSSNFRNEFNSGKYNFKNNYTLVITNVITSDQGGYLIDCWREGEAVLQSSRWQLRIPDIIPTQTTIRTTEPSLPSGPSDNAAPSSNTATGPIDSSAVIAIAICTVVIVVIVAGTVIVILRRRQPSDVKKHLVSNDDNSAAAHLRSDAESGSLYNEIGYVDLRIETESCHGSRFDLVCCGESPSLPKRPDKTQNSTKQDGASTSRATENEYAIIRDNSSIRRHTSLTGKTSDEYAKVIPKSERSASLGGIIDNGPVYAKAVPKSKRRASDNGILETLHVPRENGTLSNEINEYKVANPNIDYVSVAAIPQGMDRKSSKTNDGPMYSNMTAKQKRQSRAKSKELQYVMLDHVMSDTAHAHRDIPPEQEATGNVQYASIDFDRKAFVAPIRKAPSSWYKRRLKKKNKK